MKEVFRYYQLGPGQLHPNGWITLFAFDKFSKLLKIEHTVNVFRNYYHLIVDVDGGSDMR